MLFLVRERFEGYRDVSANGVRCKLEPDCIIRRETEIKIILAIRTQRFICTKVVNGINL
jgi:hypothetical protein